MWLLGWAPRRRKNWPATAAKTEVAAMLKESRDLRKQLEETSTGLDDFIARAERVAAVLEHPQGSIDEL